MQEIPWATTMATEYAAITALVQFGSMVVALFYLEHYISTQEDDLKSYIN